jgi:hypothetical protein
MGVGLGAQNAQSYAESGNVRGRGCAPCCDFRSCSDAGRWPEPYTLQGLVQREPITISGTVKVNVGLRPVLRQVQALSHSEESSATPVAVALRAISALLLTAQLEGDEKALFSHEAITFFWPVSEAPLAAVKLTVMAPLTQFTVAAPACMKLLQLLRRRLPVPEAQA